MNNSNSQSEDPKTKNASGVENEPDEAMNTPKDVEESNDENINEDFPGYPHYPASDDILNNDEKVDVDVENLANRGTNARLELRNEMRKPADGSINAPFDEAVEDEEDDLGIVEGTEADVTAEDLRLLGSSNADNDLGEDEEVPSVTSLLDKAGYELDTPGAELDDANESIGEEDEENNYYSLGGDRHENLEEDDRNTF
jgi:hypothetical protein